MQQLPGFSDRNKVIKINATYYFGWQMNAWFLFEVVNTNSLYEYVGNSWLNDTNNRTVPFASVKKNRIGKAAFYALIL